MKKLKAQSILAAVLSLSLPVLSWANLDEYRFGHLQRCRQQFLYGDQQYGHRDGHGSSQAGDHQRDDSGLRYWRRHELSNYRKQQSDELQRDGPSGGCDHRHSDWHYLGNTNGCGSIHHKPWRDERGGNWNGDADLDRSVRGRHHAHQERQSGIGHFWNDSHLHHSVSEHNEWRGKQCGQSRTWSRAVQRLWPAASRVAGHFPAPPLPGPSEP